MVAGGAVPRLATGPSVDRRGGIYSRPRAFAPPQGSGGTRQASPPYGRLRCGKVAVSRLAAGLPSIVGAGFIPPAGVCAAAGFPGRYGIGPYRGLRYRRRRGFPVRTGLPSIVGAGFIPPAGVCPAAGCGGMRASRPTVAWVLAAVRFGRSFSVVCRGGPWPSRETLRHRGVPGTISGLRAGPAARLASETRLRAQCKHRPLQRFAVRRERGFPVGRGIRRRP